MMNAVWEYWRAGGPLLIPLAGVSVGILALTFRTLSKLKKVVLESDELSDALEQGRLELESLEDENAPGDLRRFFRQGLREARSSDTAPLSVLENREEILVDRLKHDLLLLMALTAVAPLIGLLGTVLGMVDTFDAVAATSGETGQKVAGGISQALITTQYGLVVALPGVFGCAWIHKRIQEAAASLGRCRFLMVETMSMGRATPTD